jgi:hypothetical protein
VGTLMRWCALMTAYLHRSRPGRLWQESRNALMLGHSQTLVFLRTQLPLAGGAEGKNLCREESLYPADKALRGRRLMRTKRCG